MTIEINCICYRSYPKLLLIFVCNDHAIFGLELSLASPSNSS